MKKEIPLSVIQSWNFSLQPLYGLCSGGADELEWWDITTDSEEFVGLGIATGWTSCSSWYSYRFGRLVELDTPGGWDYGPARRPECSDDLNSVGSGRVHGS